MLAHVISRTYNVNCQAFQLFVDCEIVLQGSIKQQTVSQIFPQLQ